MSRSNAINYHTLCEEKARVEATFALAKTYFPGFVAPPDITAEHEKALACFKGLNCKSFKRSHEGLIRRAAYVFLKIRTRLEGLLQAFFRGSKEFFWKRLMAIQICVEHIEMRRAIQAMIKDVSRYGQSRYIKIHIAAERYCETYHAIEALKHAQAQLEEAAHLEGRELIWA